MNRRQRYESGSVNGWAIGAIAGLSLFLIAGSLAIWAFMAYSNQKNTVDSQIGLAVAKAENELKKVEQKKYSEEAKNPRLEFVGPETYSRVSFMYPKTWSVYVAQDGGDRKDYKAYFHPVIVPAVASEGSRFVMRLEILNQDFDKILDQYASQVKKGELSSESVEVNGYSAIRLNGVIAKDLRGSVVLIGARDKTIRLSTDADAFRPDFDAVISTIKMTE